MSVNKVILIGNVGKDPEVRHLDSNVAVANFSLATSESYTAKTGEKVTNTEWHNIVAWRGLATIAERYIKKGRQVYVEGRIRTRSYDDKDGNKHYITEIYADNISLLGKREDYEGDQGTIANNTTFNGYANNEASSPAVDDSNIPSSNEPDDDLPF